jgi:hypothetical protein
VYPTQFVSIEVRANQSVLDEFGPFSVEEIWVGAKMHDEILVNSSGRLDVNRQPEKFI